MFSFATKNSKSRPSAGHDRSNSLSPYVSNHHDFDADTSYGGAAISTIAEPSLPRPTADRSFLQQRPLHQRSMTASSTTQQYQYQQQQQQQSPATRPPLITNYSKPAVYPQQPSLPSALLDPSTDIDLEQSPATSPTTPTSPSKDRWSFLPNLKSEAASPLKATFSTSGRSSPTKNDNRTSRLADWFQGESAPISLGLCHSPTKEERSPFDDAPLLCPDIEQPLNQSSNMAPQRRPSMPSRARQASTSTSTTSSPFSLLTKTFTRPAPEPAPLASDARADEFLHLDVKAALLPESAPPFSPAAYKNLQQKAEGLLGRMQAAYRQQVLARRELEGEADAQEEELEEADVRTLHLKQQLDDLSAKSAEQDGVIAGLVEELAREKQARRDEAAASAARSVRLVEGGEEERKMQGRSRKARTSNASTTSSRISDSGFESNNDECGDDEFGTVSISTATTTPDSLRSGREWKAGHNGSTDKNVVCASCRGGNNQPQQPQRLQMQLPPQQQQQSWGLVGDLRTENARYDQSARYVETEIDKCLEMVEDAIMGLRR